MNNEQSSMSIFDSGQDAKAFALYMAAIVAATAMSAWLAFIFSVPRPALFTLSCALLSAGAFVGVGIANCTRLPQWASYSALMGGVLLGMLVAAGVHFHLAN